MRYRTALLVLTLAAFALRVHDLEAQSYWLDEVDAITMAGAPLASHLKKLTQIGENGPLYFMLFKGWVALAGTSEFGARFLSAATSTLAVPLVWAVARRVLGSAPAALAAAVLAAASPFYVRYAQDAKMYPLFAALALAAAYALLRGFAAGSRRRQVAWWSAYVVCSSLALYVHIFAVLQIAANTAAGGLLWRRRAPGRTGFLAATAALIGPYVPLALWQAPVLLRGANVGYSPTGLRDMAVALLEQFTWHVTPAPSRRWLLVLAAVLLLGLVRIATRSYRPVQPAPDDGAGALRGGDAAAVLACWLLVPLAGAYALQFTVPVFQVRYFTPLVAPFLMLLAGACLPGIRAPAGRWTVASLAATVFVAGSFAYGLAHRPRNPDFRAAAALVRRAAQPGDTIGFLAEYAERPFAYYYLQHAGRYEKARLPYTNYPGLSEAEALRAVATGLRAGQRLWIVRWEDWIWDGRNLVSRYLTERGARRDVFHDFNGVSVSHYTVP